MMAVGDGHMLPHANGGGGEVVMATVIATVQMWW